MNNLTALNKRVFKMVFRTGILLLTLLLLMQCGDSGTGPEKKENVPGKILWVKVPDSLKIPEPGFWTTALVEAAVQDSDGLADVDSVYFISRKPDGTLANNGQPFLMVDNGKPFNVNNPLVEAGDKKAGDGIYSLTIFLDNTNQPGRYYFTFYMRDKAGHRSAGVVDSIEVYQ